MPTGTDNSRVGDIYWGAWTIDASASANDTTWMVWSGDGTAPVYNTGWQPHSEEEIRVRQENLEKERVKKESAKEKALILLMTVLTDEQKTQFNLDQSFFVKSESGKRFRIRSGRVRNVDEMEGERAVARYCIHPRDRVPDEDTMIAQKLMLEADEAAFMRIANRSAVRQ